MAGREEPPKAEAWSRYGRTSGRSRGIAFAPHPPALCYIFPLDAFLAQIPFLGYALLCPCSSLCRQRPRCALALRLVQRQGRPPRRHSRCAVRLLPVIRHTHVASPRHHRGLQGRQDPRKINLGVGAYRDENGKPYILPSVQKVVIEAQTQFGRELNRIIGRGNRPCQRSQQGVPPNYWSPRVHPGTPLSWPTERKASP